MLQAVRETYRHIVMLEDGARVLLRPLVPDDLDQLIDLYSGAQPEDLLWFGQDFADPERMRAWVSSLDYNRVVPLVAIINDRIVGDATFQRRTGPHSHIGEVRVFLASDFRSRGLGTAMLRTLVELARKTGLHWLHAEVFINQTVIIKALGSLGFSQQGILEDFFMLPNGQTKDIAVLRLRLLKRNNEF